MAVIYTNSSIFVQAVGLLVLVGGMTKNEKFGDDLLIFAEKLDDQVKKFSEEKAKVEEELAKAVSQQEKAQKMNTLDALGKKAISLDIEEGGALKTVEDDLVKQLKSKTLEFDFDKAVAESNSPDTLLSTHFTDKAVAAAYVHTRLDEVEKLYCELADKVSEGRKVFIPQDPEAMQRQVAHIANSNNLGGQDSGGPPIK